MPRARGLRQLDRMVPCGARPLPGVRVLRWPGERPDAPGRRQLDRQAVQRAQYRLQRGLVGPRLPGRRGPLGSVADRRGLATHAPRHGRVRQPRQDLAVRCLPPTTTTTVPAWPPSPDTVALLLAGTLRTETTGSRSLHRGRRTPIGCAAWLWNTGHERATLVAHACDLARSQARHATHLKPRPYRCATWRGRRASAPRSRSSPRARRHALALALACPPLPRARLGLPPLAAPPFLPTHPPTTPLRPRRRTRR